jgi:hypothetical protein
VVDLTARTVVAMERSKQVDYAVQRGRLRALSERWQPEQIIAEQNGMGLPIIEQLTRDGLRIAAFTTTNASKAQVIEALALAFERGDIRIPNHPVLAGELVAYQAERLPSGLTRYGAPSGQHDDTVIGSDQDQNTPQTGASPAREVRCRDLPVRTGTRRCDNGRWANADPEGRQRAGADIYHAA